MVKIPMFTMAHVPELICRCQTVFFVFVFVFLIIHRSDVLKRCRLHETAAVSAQVLCTPCNHAPCHFMQNHIRKVYECLAVTCHPHFWQNDQVLLRATNAVTRGWNGYWIRVSIESWPWRRKFSRRSCRDSNPRPFNHESGALTTELSPPPQIYWTRKKSNNSYYDADSALRSRMIFTKVWRSSVI